MECRCGVPPFSADDFECFALEEDSRGSASLETCKKCGANWLKYLIEDEAFSKSGRWWRVPVSEAELKGVEARNAKEFIESKPWAFVGGSYYDGKIDRVDRPTIS